MKAATSPAKTDENLDTALVLCGLGYWAIPIHRAGVAIKTRSGEKIAKGKEPIGNAWGATRRDEAELRSMFAKNPGDGIGIGSGPGRAPDGRWLIDIEGDGPKAANSLSIVLGTDQEVLTPSWNSRRGGHAVFVADEGEARRLLDLLTAAGAKEGAGIKAGVWHLPDELPDLEWRIGGYKADGAVKQVQSVVPPTMGEDDMPRTWRVGPETPVAELPPSVCAVLEALVEMVAERKAIVAEGNGEPPNVDSVWTDPKYTTVTKGGVRAKVWTIEDRAIAYLATAESAISGQHGHDKTFGVVCRTCCGFDLSQDDALRLIRQHYNPRCEPPWSEAEFLHKIEDAYRTETRRGWLLDNAKNSPGLAGRSPSSNGDGHPQINRTDLGNAQRLVALHGEDFRYSHPWSKFLVWDKRRWNIDNTAAVCRWDRPHRGKDPRQRR